MGKDYFKNTIEFLKKMQTPQKYTIEIEIDEDGYYDKECPNEECLQKFKVKAEDWINKIIPNDKCHCPFCGYVKGYNSWWTTEQIEQAKRQTIEQVSAEFGSALDEDVRRFNKSQPKNSFIKFSMTFSGKKHAVNLLAEALETMKQKVTCEECGTQYAVIGSAFFCPNCGQNSAEKTFSNTIAKVNAKIDNIEIIRNALLEVSKDDSEYTCQSLIESSISDLVVALQRLCESIYPKLANALPLKRNVFQRIDDSNALWKNICGKDYTDWLTANEYKLLIKCFQQRHILQHKDGIIDSDYLVKSGDINYIVGQRLVVKEDDIKSYCAVISKLGEKITKLQ